ncbi:LysE family translocator [Elizabethkingia anophelis]|uniref:LysE family translocator n=1 Tax=Elizabethkingia anophelis R26 TaxID=1246994 RepID=A0ABM6MPZ9_9FLAO|nr:MULTISPECIES: LysE family translocator [Elizabethkingia]ATC35177.1 LysE family translocator [Elizabethkingia anophelis R26]ATC38817.1 LysE family translocator [Elizabethkingia anophelis Ag1]ATC42497.1 LysE family translocator [Elizabethkingia anophelis]ATC46173.1 LysE family translocator [Elizabethkingia anophelis]ELR80413.1 lysine exporter protein LysE/YggA [Elizabethkingia anophelis R26]
MIPIHDLILFIIAAFILVISPGPNMIYLISRTITQGRKAGLTSLAGVICGFLFHIVMVSFGLTAVLFAVPYAYVVLKILGTVYLLYLAYQAIKPNSKNIFEVDQNISIDRPRKLFTVGFLTNVLNPKVAVFYLSFFPQFIKPQYGSIFTQSLELGVIQVFVSFSINFIIVLTAAQAARFFAKNPTWIKAQKWFMASVLGFLAIKMALSKAK